MHLGLDGKPILVMAAAGGIGRGIATEFAKEGAKVMMFDKDADALARAAVEIGQQTGNRPIHHRGDICNSTDVKGVVQRTVNELGGLFGLINNTGGPPAGKFDSFDDDAWLNAFNLTLLAYVRSIREVLPIMKAAGGGRIVNNTSSSIRAAIDDLILSNAFRTGIMGLSKSLARELGSSGILVNVIGPGRIDTPRVAHLDGLKAKREGICTEEIRAAQELAIPLGRYGTVDEIAKLAVFLGSEANTYITGQSILVDGGMVSAY
jgi:3-oxoacyl-[acyl-carrier protein] reductase